MSKGQKRKKIQCPNMILMYNAGMGEVDLADMLIALYRIKDSKVVSKDLLALH